jgi:hypothetical protein
MDAPIKFEQPQKQAEFPLPVELREFIDAVIVPILVTRFLSTPGRGQLAPESENVPKSPSATAA